MKKNAMKLASRVKDLKPEGAYAVLARALELERRGRDVIHLEIGQPDFETFPHIVEAGIQALRDGQTRYNPPVGIHPLREAVATDAGLRRGIKIKTEQVVIGPGAKPGLFFPALAIIEPEDQVLYPDPGFPTYADMIRVANGTPVPVPLKEEKGFSFDLKSFDERISARTRLIILNSPSNPTGGVIPLEDLKHIAEKAREYDCWVLSDEIYTRMVYDGLTAPSIAALDDMMKRTVIVDGFSKTYAMTGWRLGYTIMPEELADRIGLLLTHAVGCTATFTQYAGIIALEADQHDVDRVVSEYQKRRDIMVDGLNSLPGVSCRKPQGAFYVFPNIASIGLSSQELASRLLDKAGVAVLPGTDFGPCGEGYLRLCYAATVEKIECAVERMRKLLKEL